MTTRIKLLPVSMLIKVHCLSLLVSLTPVLSAMMETPFVRVPSPQYGPERLGTGWMDRSLLSCVTTCMIRYHQTCQSVMYNTSTHLCTPGTWLNQSQPRPDVKEGQLYATYQCTDPKHFQMYTYNKTAACVSIYRTKLTYWDAQTACENLGSHLYTPRTLDKFYLMQSIIDFEYYWVGLNDMVNEGVYVFEDSSGESIVVNDTLQTLMFPPTEPNDMDGGEDCIAVITLNGNDKMLNDDACSRVYFYICEKPMLTW